MSYSNNEQFSWKSSDNEEDDDVDDQSDDDGDSQGDGDQNDDNEKTESENDGVNVEEEKLDEDMTNKEEEMDELHLIEDTHVITTVVTPEAQHQSSSVSSCFISNMLNPNPDTGIDSILNLNIKSTSLVDVPITTNVGMLPSSATTLLLPHIPLVQPQHQTPIPLPAIVSTVQLQSYRLREEAQADNEDFVNQLDENIKIIKEQAKVQVKEQVTKILPRNTVTIKRRRDNEDEDEEPSDGSNQGSKKRRARKEPGSTCKPKEKTSKSTGKSKEGSNYHQKSTGKSTQAEEPIHTIDNLEEPTPQEFNTGFTEDQPVEEASQHPDCIAIQRRVEDLQLGVKSYQKKLNLTRSDTYRSYLKSFPTYSTYPNPRGFIYQNKDKMNILMRIYELYKFSDGTLNDAWTPLDDILKRIRMKYLPKTYWRNVDKERAGAMIQHVYLRVMSSPNHPTSNIEDAFSSNFPDYIPASPDYVPASPGKTYSSSSNNSFGLISKLITKKIRKVSWMQSMNSKSKRKDHRTTRFDPRVMSSPNHPTSNIEDAFSSNFPDYIPASPDYVPASPGKTYSNSSNNSFGLSAFPTQGTISSIPIVLSWSGSIRSEGFLSSVLLWMVIIVAVVGITVVVVVESSSIVKLSFVIT
nr:hypothetical protein [Tanacetum cinerariifolium]